MAGIFVSPCGRSIVDPRHFARRRPRFPRAPREDNDAQSRHVDGGARVPRSPDRERPRGRLLRRCAPGEVRRVADRPQSPRASPRERTRRPHRRFICDLPRRATPQGVCSGTGPRTRTIRLGCAPSPHASVGSPRTAVPTRGWSRSSGALATWRCVSYARRFSIAWPSARGPATVDSSTRWPRHCGYTGGSRHIRVKSPAWPQRLALGARQMRLSQLSRLSALPLTSRRAAGSRPRVVDAGRGWRPIALNYSRRPRHSVNAGRRFTLLSAM